MRWLLIETPRPGAFMLDLESWAILQYLVRDEYVDVPVVRT